MITLEQLLSARDARAARQKELLAAYPGCTLLCFTVQLPGAVKRNAESLIIGGAGLAALLDRFGSVLKHVQVKDLETGYEAYILVPLPQKLVKEISCELEETHPLGRLMDIDVIGMDGIPVGREAIGKGLRKCLLCSNEVRFCMRARTHSVEELEAKVNEIVETYVKKGNS